MILSSTQLLQRRHPNMEQRYVREKWASAVVDEYPWTQIGTMASLSSSLIMFNLPIGQHNTFDSGYRPAHVQHILISRQQAAEQQPAHRYERISVKPNKNEEVASNLELTAVNHRGRPLLQLSMGRRNLHVVKHNGIIVVTTVTNSESDTYLSSTPRGKSHVG